jgi:ribosomal protein L12E/L44/L45/RPP1/RPP2
MKEVLTKRFWQGVKKTFDEALENPAPKDAAAPPSTADAPKASSPPAAQTSSATREGK